MPERAVRLLAFLFHLLKQGTEAEVLPDAKVGLGFEPISFDQFAHDYAPAWA